MNQQTEQSALANNRNKTLALLIFGAAFAAFFIFDGPKWLNLDTIQQHRETLFNYASQNYWLLFFASAAVYITATALSVPGGIVLSLLCGFLFGRWMGSLLIIISATLGATLIFLLARYLIADWAEQKLQSHPRAAKLIKGFDSDAFNYMLFLRLVPLFPFWLVNLAPAFTPISTRVYMLSTLLGIIPGSFVFANLGKSLGQIEHLQQLLSMEVVLAFSLLGILSLLPILLKRLIPGNPQDE